MNTVSRIVRLLLPGVAILCMWSADVRAIDVPLTPNDIERALALARWPHSDAERTLLHQRYVIRVDEPPIDSWTVEQVEVITEFRRVELMAEEHVLMNDLWGRGGHRDVEEAILPWRGRVSIVVHLGLRATQIYVGGLPPVEVVIGGPGAIVASDGRRTNLYSNCNGDPVGCPLVGGLVEQVADAAAVGQTTRPVSVLWNGRALARVIVDFAALE